MKSAMETILKNNMFQKGDKVAVACSGGIDSMCLLHHLFSNKKNLGIEVFAVNVDHGIRENSADDSKFVEKYCKDNGILCYKFSINAIELSKKEKTGLEETARNARYKIFKSLIDKKIADKIAIAHHSQDQVETVLLNIFRGSGLKGASGMKAISNNFVRPLIETTKQEIETYAKQNNIPFVFDQTNNDDKYSRNAIRLNILPELRKIWKNIDKNILNFSKLCKQDDEYINSTIDFDNIIIEKNMAQIPCSCFALNEPIQNRILKYVFEKLNLSKDIEYRHIELLKNLATSGKNGSKINLPNNLKAHLEYDSLIITTNKKTADFEQKDFKPGTTHFENFGEITIKKTQDIDFSQKNCQKVQFGESVKMAMYFQNLAVVKKN